MFQSTEAYGFVSKDLEEVSSQAITVFGSTASNIKQTLEVGLYFKEIILNFGDLGVSSSF